MAARSKARKRALDYLFAAEMKSISPVEVLETEVTDGRRTVHPYTDVLVRGVVEQQARLDQLISAYSHSWTLERMPAVDRNALRIGLWEVLYADDVPDVVAVDEAVSLVKDLSTDESPAFVNGVLDALRREQDSLPEPVVEDPAAGDLDDGSTPAEGNAEPLSPATAEDP